MRFLLIAIMLASAPPAAFAQDAPPAAGQTSLYAGLTQIELTEAQVQHYVAAIADMQKAMAGAPADSEQPDPKAMARLEVVAKTYQFKNFDEFNVVAGNLALALDGIDPKTRTYVGAEARLKQAIADTEADAKLPDEEKKATLEALRQELKSVTPVKFKGNIDLAIRHYEALNGAD